MLGHPIEMIIARRYIIQSPEGEYLVDQRRKSYMVFLVLMRYHDTKYNTYLIGVRWERFSH